MVKRRSIGGAGGDGGASLSQILDALRAARGAGVRPLATAAPRAHRVVTVASPKGGVGKTTFATNLAVTLRALREDLDVLFVPLDDQPLPDRMFWLGTADPAPTVSDAIAQGSLAGAIRLGQFGVHHVPAAPDAMLLRESLRTPRQLELSLRRSAFPGLVILDTRSDLDLPTQAALAASDLAVVVVREQASLHEAGRIFDLLDTWQRPRSRARVLLSAIDLRVKYAGSDEPDILALLLAGLRRRGYPHFATFLSHSPAVPALTTNPAGRAAPVLSGAPATRVSRQLRALAEELLAALEEPCEESASPAPIAASARSAPAAAAAMPAPAGSSPAPRHWILRASRPPAGR